MSKTKLIICPYCGDTQPPGDACRACGGLFEQLSRQATHNQMGPWFVRDEKRPFQPGCSYETLVKLIQRGQVTKYSILRGPTTRQFWTVARHVPGVAHLLGYCHACDAQVDPGDHGCHACGVAFGAYLDRNFLGLPEIRPLPWELDANEEIRQAASGHRMAWDQPVRGGSLSSFATDEELYGHSAFEPLPEDAAARAGRGVAIGTTHGSGLRGFTGATQAAHAVEATGAPMSGPGGASLAAFVQTTRKPTDSSQLGAQARRLRAQQRKRVMTVICVLLLLLIVFLTLINGAKIASLLGGE